MKKNLIYSVAALAMIFMLVSQASAGGIASAIAAKESGLRKALTNHLKKAARDVGLVNIDGSSLAIYSTPNQYGVAAKVQDGNGVIAIAYFDTKNLKGLFTIETEVDAVGLMLYVLLHEVSSNEEFRFEVKRTVEDTSGELPIAIDNSTNRRIWCFPGEDGTVSFCADLDAAFPFD